MDEKNEMHPAQKFVLELLQLRRMLHNKAQTLGAVAEILDATGLEYQSQRTIMEQGYELTLDFWIPSIQTHIKVWDTQDPSFQMQHFQAYRELVVDQRNEDLHFLRILEWPVEYQAVEHQVLLMIRQRQKIFELYRDINNGR